MKRQFGFYCVVLVSLFASATAWAVSPQAEEFHLHDQWMVSLFDSMRQVIPSHLKLLYEDAAKGISRKRLWRGTPTQLRR